MCPARQLDPDADVVAVNLSPEVHQQTDPLLFLSRCTATLPFPRVRRDRVKTQVRAVVCMNGTLLHLFSVCMSRAACHRYHFAWLSRTCCRSRHLQTEEVRPRPMHLALMSSVRHVHRRRTEDDVPFDPAEAHWCLAQ